MPHSIPPLSHCPSLMQITASRGWKMDQIEVNIFQAWKLPSNRANCGVACGVASLSALPHMPSKLKVISSFCMRRFEYLANRHCMLGPPVTATAAKSYRGGGHPVLSLTLSHAASATLEGKGLAGMVFSDENGVLHTSECVVQSCTRNTEFHTSSCSLAFLVLV